MNSNSYFHESRINFKDNQDYPEQINFNNDNEDNDKDINKISSQDNIKLNDLSNNQYDYQNFYSFSPSNNKNTLSENENMNYNSDNMNNKGNNLSQILSDLNSYYLNLYKKSEKELNELKIKYYSIEKENNENKELLEESNKERDELTEKVDKLNNQLDKIFNIVKDVNLQKQALENEYLNFKENTIKEIKKDYNDKLSDIMNENKEKINLLNTKNEELQKENEILKYELKFNKNTYEIKEYKKDIDNSDNTYQKDIENKNNLIEKLREEILNLKKDLKSKEEEYINKENIFKSEINKLNEIINENMNKLNEIKNEYDLLTKKELINEKSIIELKNNCLTKLNDNSNLKKEIIKKNEEIEDLLKEISKLQRNIAHLSQNNFNLNQIIKSFQEIENDEMDETNININDEAFNKKYMLDMSNEEEKKNLNNIIKNNKKREEGNNIKKEESKENKN